MFNKYFSEPSIVTMLELFIYLLCLVDLFLLQTVTIPMSTNCAPLLVDLFFYFYVGNFEVKRKKLALSFHFTFHYTDDIRSVQKSKFGDC